MRPEAACCYSAPVMNNQTTSWSRVLIAVLAGFAVAFQIGKVPVALPAIRAELGLSLSAAASIVSVFSLLGATIGLALGFVVDRAGRLRMAIASLAVAAAGGLIGAFSHDLFSLLASRIVEGLGFIVAALALPPLVVASASMRDRPVVLGIWGAFVPGGMGLMLLLSPLLLAIVGWRGLWASASIMILFCCALLWWGFRDYEDSPPAREPGAWRVAFARGPLLLAGCFMAYSAQFIAVTAFIPSMFIELNRASVAGAALLSAIVVVSNVVGNVASGWFLRHGVGRRVLLAGAMVLMAAAGFLVFRESSSLVTRFVAALIFAAVGGLLPGGMFASAPEYISKPAQLSIVVGLMLQGSGVGQVLGPLGLTGVVESAGSWSAGPVFTLGAALVGLICIAFLPPNPSKEDRAQRFL